MKRFLTVTIIAIVALWATAGDAGAWGREHYHGRRGTSVHFGFFFASPVYPAPRYHYRPHHHHHYPHRPYGLVLEFPVLIWSHLSDYDRTLASQSTYYALEKMRSGEAVEWRDPDTGMTGKVSPRPAYQNAQGTYCREFQQTVTIGGEAQEAYGTACRQPDGSWRIVR